VVADALKAKICADLPSTCADLTTEGTPQRKALEWVASHTLIFHVTVDDENGEKAPPLPPELEWRYIQRYALVVVGFSLEGWESLGIADWMDDDGGGTVHECLWKWGPSSGGSDENSIECDASGRLTRVGFKNKLLTAEVLPKDVALLNESLGEFTGGIASCVASFASKAVFFVRKFTKRSFLLFTTG